MRILIAALLAIFWGMADTAAGEQKQAAVFVAQPLRIIDGDTFEARVRIWPRVTITVAVRLAGVDTPEMRGKCESERVKAKAAAVRLTELLTGDVLIYGVHEGKFAGRVIATVIAEGDIDVAATLIAEGLGRPYDGGKRQGWCEV